MVSRHLLKWIVFREKMICKLQKFTHFKFHILKCNEKLWYLLDNIKETEKKIFLFMIQITFS